MSRTRIVYVAGPFRHWLEDQFGQRVADGMKMDDEYEDEGRWAQVVMECGHIALPPLHATDFLAGVVPDDEIMRRELAFLDVLQPGYDLILMRHGWEDSEGAQGEHDYAQERGLLTVYGCQGEAWVRWYLTEGLDGAEPPEALLKGI